MRVVSLVPSVTETMRAWGIDPIACTRYCEQPDLATIGGTKNPEVAAIVELGPDLVVLDKVENRREDAEALEAAGLDLHVTDVRTLGDVVPELDALAARLGLDSQTRDWPSLPSVSVTASCFVPIWRRPWMTIGADTFGSTLLEALGFANVYADAAVDYPEVELAEVRRRRPDMVLAPTEPYEFSAAHLEELEVVAPVVVVDGQDLFWWGSRTPAAVERLVAALGPIAQGGFDKRG